MGLGAIVVEADDVGGFAQALELLLTHEELRYEMGSRARSITVPFFTWRRVASRFLDELGFRAVQSTSGA